MSDLLSKIYAAQRDAAERAVIEHLESKGLKASNVEALKQQANSINPISRDLHHCPPGQWKVVRINGVIEVNLSKPTMRDVHEAVGSKFLHGVSLRDGGELTGIVMLADDFGFAKQLPFNKLASELYRVQCGNPAALVCGDVAIVNDADF